MTTRAAPRPFRERLARLDDADVRLTVDGSAKRVYVVTATSKGSKPHEVVAFHVEHTGWIVEMCDCDFFKFGHDERGCVHCERIRQELGTSTMTDIKTFEPGKHLIRVQGNREYLTVAGRLKWFRQDRPEWGIKTEVVTIDVVQKYAIFRAEIYDENGRLVACGTKHEDAKGFPDFIEKAEKGAIGRALGVAGYGTDDLEGDEDHEANVRPADAPSQARTQRQAQPPRNGAQKPAETHAVVQARIEAKSAKLHPDDWKGYFDAAIGDYAKHPVEYLLDVEREIDKQLAAMA